MSAVSAEATSGHVASAGGRTAGGWTPGAGACALGGACTGGVCATITVRMRATVTIRARIIRVSFDPTCYDRCGIDALGACLSNRNTLLEDHSEGELYLPAGAEADRSADGARQRAERTGGCRRICLTRLDFLCPRQAVRRQLVPLRGPRIGEIRPV